MKKHTQSNKHANKQTSSGCSLTLDIMLKRKKCFIFFIFFFKEGKRKAYNTHTCVYRANHLPCDGRWSLGKSSRQQPAS